MIAKLLSERPVSSIAFLLAHPTLCVAAALGDPWLFGCAAAVSYAADQRLSEAGTRLFVAMRRARLGLTLRLVDLALPVRF